MHQVKDLEEADDLESAAVLQIRILQLLCKTLPSHPEYRLPENEQTLKEIGGIARVAFSNIERLADAINDTSASLADNGGVVPSADRPINRRQLQVSAGLLELFERIAADNSAKQVTTVGILAGRYDDRDLSDPSATQDSQSDLQRISALIIPSQTSLPDRADIRYASDVSQLLKVKGLLRFGFIEMCPNQERNKLHSHSVSMLAELQNEKPEAATIVVTPKDASKICSFSLSPHGLAYVLACSAKEQWADDVIPGGWRGEGGAPWEVANHVDIRNSNEPPFKLYDLRPLALARDEHERSTKSGAAM